MARKAGNKAERHPRHEYFIEDQVIVTGPEDVVQSLMAGLPDVEATPIRVLRLAELGEQAIGGDPLPPNPIIALYRLTGSAPDIKKAVRSISEALTGSHHRISAEPNFLAGHPWEPEGGPWEPEGGPWEPEGGPWEPEGGSQKHPHHMKTDTRLAQPDWFMTQWAMDRIGWNNAIGPTGAGVRVGIFDTSPYWPEVPDGTQVDKVVTLAQTPGAMTVHVRHPIWHASPAPSKQQQYYAGDHGIFVTGLIHAVAPECELHLVRVLDQYTRGSLFTLLEAFYDFLKELVTNPPAKGAVANLSLGIRVPPKEARFGLPEEIQSLHYLMLAARRMNVVIIAAAGNDTKGGPHPQPMQAPASFDTAIGVAASNQEDVRACFSNCGDIAAPGGDGDRGCRPCNTSGEDGDSAESLVGPILYPDDDSVTYIFWSGTSFATPLVSGLAALILSQCGPLSAQEVEQYLRQGAQPSPDDTLGAGVIRIPQTLALL